MSTYVMLDDDGQILAVADWNFEGSHAVDYTVERDSDGRLYKSGTLPTPTEAQLFERLRIETERRLASTDKYATVDYPDNALRQKVLAYRAALRALNHQPGAPFDGGGEQTPWPTKPIIESN